VCINASTICWIAPVLSFTSDEIWQQLKGQAPNLNASKSSGVPAPVNASEKSPGKDGPSLSSSSNTRENSVFTATYLDALFPLESDSILSNNDWAQIIELRTHVSKALETLRAAGDIGGGLEASVTLYCSENLASLLSRLEDELRFVLITSTATVRALSEATDASSAQSVGEHQVIIEATPAEGEKCARCWHRRTDVGQDNSHPELCARCVSNVTSNGESRLIA